MITHAKANPGSLRKERDFSGDLRDTEPQRGGANIISSMIFPLVALGAILISAADLVR